MKIILILSWLLFAMPSESFYSISINASHGAGIDLNTFQGKRVLIVNVATGSQRAAQFSELQQLYQTHGDSLVILAVPSNSFGNEPGADNAIASHLVQQYGLTFPITQKMETAGDNKHPLYQWLTDSTRNGSAYSQVGGDFQKYLISKEGELMGIFSPAVSPLSQEFLTAFKY